MDNFDKQIKDLREGKIDKIEVKNDLFFLWREEWMKQEDKKFFRGIAGLNGNVEYVYDKTVI